MADQQSVWLIRTWCNQDRFWDTIRENKPYNIAYKSAESAHKAILKIIETETTKWKDCEAFPPKLEELKTTIFRRFLSIQSKGINGDDLSIQFYVYKMPCQEDI